MSLATRLVALDSKATYRPVESIDDSCEVPLAWAPPLLTETRVTAPVTRCRTKMSRSLLVSPMTRLNASVSKAIRRALLLTAGLVLGPPNAGAALRRSTMIVSNPGAAAAGLAVAATMPTTAATPPSRTVRERRRGYDDDLIARTLVAAYCSQLVAPATVR